MCRTALTALNGFITMLVVFTLTVRRTALTALNGFILGIVAEGVVGGSHGFNSPEWIHHRDCTDFGRLSGRTALTALNGFIQHIADRLGMLHVARL